MVLFGNINKPTPSAMVEIKLIEFRETRSINLPAILSQASNEEGATTIPQGSRIK